MDDDQTPRDPESGHAANVAGDFVADVASEVVAQGVAELVADGCLEGCAQGCAGCSLMVVLILFVAGSAVAAMW